MASSPLTCAWAQPLISPAFFNATLSDALPPPVNTFCPPLKLAGPLVPIQDNVFLMGLDRSEGAQQRNMDLLRFQRWMVFDVRLANNRRAAFLVEKGSAGERAVNEALAAWK